MKIYVNMVVWGDVFLERLATLVLPSLMSPGNIPALAAAHDVSFWFYTTPEDAKKMESIPIFQRLIQIVKVNIIDIASVNINDMDYFKDWGENKFKAMSSSHLHAMYTSWKDDAGMITLAPDVVVSEGIMARVVEIIATGKRGIMWNHMSALESTFGPAFLQKFPPDENGIRAIPPRELTSLALEHRHPWTDKVFVDLAGFNVSSQMYWKVGDEGYVARAWHLVPLFIYPQRLPDHFFWSVDNDYTVQVIDDVEDLYIIQDSDEACFVELLPPDPYRYTRDGSKPFNPLFHALDGLDMFTSEHNYFWVKHNIRWHSGEMSPLWDEVERQADQVVDSVLEWMQFLKKRASARGEIEVAVNSGKMELSQMASKYRVDAAQTHVLLGIELYRSGKVDDAETQFKKANEILPQWVDPWASLGKLYYDSNRYVEAVQALVEALKITPRDADLWIGIPLSAHGLQDRAMLSEAYEQARACDPSHSQLVHLEKFLADEA